MVYLISGLLTGGVLAAVCWPLLGRQEAVESAILEETEWDLLQRKKEVVLGNIQDLDFEYECGKLSAVDHGRVREELAGEAAAVFEAIDRIENDQDLDALIRREVDQRRARVSDAPACAGCGHRNPAENKFCTECGQRMTV
jgi:hypothetical protein